MSYLFETPGGTFEIAITQDADVPFVQTATLRQLSGPRLSASEWRTLADAWLDQLRAAGAPVLGCEELP